MNSTTKLRSTNVPLLTHPKQFPGCAQTMLLTLCLLPLCASAQNIVQISTPRQPLHQALIQIGQQTSRELVYTQKMVAGKTAPPVSGALTREQALDRILAGSGLIAVIHGNTIVIEPDTRNTATLTTVNVTARRVADGTTEGTGSYTSRVTSIASKSDLAFREVPQAVSVITRQRLDDQHLVSISDALQMTPGVTVQRFNAEFKNFYSRGFEITSMQVDGGAPLALGSYTYAPTQDMAFFDRVEVMRGASGLLGGMGDPGGIINLVRKKPLADYQLIFEASAGSWDSYRSMLDVTGPIAFNGSVRGRGVVVYDDSRSFLSGRSEDSPKVYGVLEADLTPNTLVTIGGSYSKRLLRGGGDGLPRYIDGRNLDLPRSTLLGQPWAYDDKKTKQLFAQLEHRFGRRWKFKLNYTLEDTDGRAHTSLISGGISPMDGTGATWGGGRYVMSNRQDMLDLNLSGSFDWLGGTHEVLFGADWQRTMGTWVTGKPLDNWQVPADVFRHNSWNPDMAVPMNLKYDPWGQEQKGVYGVLRINPIERLHLIAGARLSRFEFSQGIFSTTGTGGWQLDSRTNYSEPTTTTPYGGIIYDLNETWSAYLSYSTIYKPQGLLKMAPLPGSSLAAIKGKSYEGGLKGELLQGRMNATFSIFNVERTGTGIADPRYPESSTSWSGTCCFLPQGEVISRGFDMELGGQVMPSMELGFGYTFNSTKDKTSNIVFSSITPRHLFKLSAVYTLPNSLDRWRIGTSLHVQSASYVSGSVYTLDGNSTQFKFNGPGYALLNGMVQYRLDPRWSLTLNVNNLLDKTYYERVNGVTGGNWYGTPRSWGLTLRATY